MLVDPAFAQATARQVVEGENKDGVSKREKTGVGDPSYRKRARCPLAPQARCLCYGRREFLLQIEHEFPVAVHVRAPDHDVDSPFNEIAPLFGVVAVTNCRSRAKAGRFLAI